MDRKIKALLIFMTICVVCCCKYGYASSMKNVMAAGEEEPGGRAEGFGVGAEELGGGAEESSGGEESGGEGEELGGGAEESGNEGEGLSGKEDSEFSPDLRPIPEIKGYCVQYGAADGENGYYRHVPQIELVHRDTGFETHYRFWHPDGRVEEGILKEEGSRKWSDLKGDGEWRLQTELIFCGDDREDKENGENEEKGEDEENEENGEDVENGENEENGERKGGEQDIEDSKRGEKVIAEWEKAWDEFESNLKGWRKEYHWNVDSTIPAVQVLSPQNVDNWYRSAVTVRLGASDTGSGIQRFAASCGGKEYSSKNKKDLVFQIHEESRNGRPVHVDIEVADNAGNLAQKRIELYIDQTEPKVEIGGADAHQISGKNVKILFAGQDENGLANVEARVEWTLSDGEKKSSMVDGWKENAGRKNAEVILEQDGIYQLTVTAVDAAGNKSTLDRQVIVDKTPPDICLPEGLDGSVRREFDLDQDLEDMVTDLTTVSVQAELDGRLFYSGKEIKKEGRHTLLFKAVDAAGNHSEKQAEFRIDRTPPVIQIWEESTKKAVDDGNVYEEKLRLKIMTKDSADKIRAVWVNGIRQKNEENPTFKYTIEEPGHYEIRAEAYDDAGNVNDKIVSIQIKTSGITSDKRTAPIMKLFRGFSEEAGGSSDGAREEMAGGYGWIIAGIAALGILIGGGVFFAVRYRKRSGKETPEMERWSV